MLNWYFYVANTDPYQVQSLIDSIETAQSQCGTELVLTFCGKSIDFQVQSMLLRRETVHNSPVYPDLLLHLTEVQDLNIGPFRDDPGIYQGTIHPQNKMINDHRLWWEASI